MFPRIISVIILISISTSLFASGSISVQGVLRKANGSAVLDSDENGDGIIDNHYNFIFTIYTSETGGSVLSTCPGNCIFSYNSHPVKNGVYNVELPVGEYLNESGDHWVGVEVNNNQLSPRLKLNVTPYEQLHLAQGASNSIDPLNGFVGLGTQSPSSFLDVAGGRIKDKTGYIAPVGSIMMHAGTGSNTNYDAPEGWLFLNGTTPPDYWSNPKYDELQSILGTTWGSAGALPDFGGRTVVGQDYGGDSDFNSINDNGGTKGATHNNHTHADDIYATQGYHNHDFHDPGHIHAGDTFHHYQWGWDGNYGPGSGGGYGSTVVSSNTTSITHNQQAPAISVHGSVGSSQGYTSSSVANMSPYRVLNFIIKY